MNTLSISKFLFLMLLGLAIALPGQADGAQTGTVEGVVEVDSTPVPDVRIAITCSAGSDYEGSAASNEIGYFEFSGVPLGDFFVEVFNAEDELIAEGQGTLNSDGQTVTVELQPHS